MNIKLINKNGNKDYIFYLEINLSIQSKNTEGTIKEIICKINN